MAKWQAAWAFVVAFVRSRWGYRFASRAQLLRHQARALAKHRARWWARTDFYRPYVARPDDVPIMDKARMMAHFDALNSAGLTHDACLAWAQAAEASRDFSGHLNGVVVGLSSGTSAVRGLFLVSPLEQARWAGSILAALLPRPLWRRQKMALFLRANSGLYEQLGKGRWLQFAFFDLSRPFDELCAQLKQFQPTVLVAPAQCLQLLADAQPSLAIAPRQVIAVAESLPDDVREQVQKTWHVTVDEIYQATEGFLAVSCAAHRLHLNEAFVRFEFEVLDAASRRVVPIITDFSRTTQLMVRYRLDDVLMMSDEDNCPCGQKSRIIDKVEGRCDDVLTLPSVRGGSVAVFPDFISRALLQVAGLMDFRVTQTSAQRVVVRYVGSASTAQVQAALAAVWHMCGVVVACDIQSVAAFEVNLMHKRRRIVGCSPRVV
ncbi:MAG: F390 synthetase-related protein [Formosimonas sp.]